MYHPLNGQIFPTVNSYGSFMSLVGEKDEIKTGVANGFQTVSYVVSLPTTFDSPAARECRGIVFNPDGLVVSRPLHKFFNLNERDGARPEDFDWSKLMRVMDKRDGSMIHTVNVGLASPFRASTTGEWTFDLKSKKSFTSDVAVAAKKWLLTNGKGAHFMKFCQEMVDLDYTAIFEYTSPTARIVLPYATEELTLLHIRDNMTGRYMSPGELHAHASGWGIPIVSPNTAEGTDALFDEMLSGERNPKDIWHAVQKLAETIEGIEGWIFQFESGDMVKVKTKWYIERHHAMTNLRERDLHLECLRETVDDLKAMLVQEGVDVTEIEGIEMHVGEYLKGMLHSIYAKLEENKHLDRKSFAMKVGPAGEGYEYFGLLMKAYEGKEPDVKGHYERHVLPTVSLRQLNLTQSKAEVE